MTSLLLRNARCRRISTHTLTWSVTSDTLYKQNHLHISTHTLTWSVTSSSVAVLDLIAYFNSHAHVERDAIDEYLRGNVKISTHTLTWSVSRTASLRQK